MSTERNKRDRSASVKKKSGNMSLKGNKLIDHNRQKVNHKGTRVEGMRLKSFCGVNFDLVSDYC